MPVSLHCVPIDTACLYAVHSAYEKWAHDNGNFDFAKNAPTWFSTNPYSTAIQVATMNRSSYAVLWAGVEATYDSGEINPKGLTKTIMRNLTNVAWGVVGSGLKGVYRWNTASSLSPEVVDMYLALVNQYDSSLTVGAQVRLSLNSVQTLFMPKLMTAQEIVDHGDDLGWWEDSDNNVILQHPSFDAETPAADQDIDVINAVCDDGFCGADEAEAFTQHADLSLRFLTFDQISPDTGATLGITAIVVNEGGAASVATTVVLRIDGQQVDSQTLDPVLSLKGVAVSLSWTTTSLGAHDVEVEVDPAGLVVESGWDDDLMSEEANTDNNTSSQTIYVGFPPDPTTGAVKRFDTTVGGTFSLPTNELELTLPANYSSVSPYITGGQEATAGKPFIGGFWVSQIFSLGPANRTLSPDVTIRLNFSPVPLDTQEFLDVYRFEEGDTVATQRWVRVPNTTFDFGVNEATFDTDELGVFAVISAGPQMPALSGRGLALIAFLLLTTGLLIVAMRRVQFR